MGSLADRIGTSQEWVNFTQYRAVKVFTESYAPDKWKIIDTKRGCNGYLKGDYPSRDLAMAAIRELSA